MNAAGEQGIERILVVDDERSMQLAMKLALRTGGWEVEAASHAEEANAACDRTTFDLVVLDYMLPETNGLVLAQSWRAAGSSVPILLVSAQTDGPVVWRALKLGIIDMIAKPMDPAQLRRRVHAMLRRRSDAQAPDAPALARGLYALQLQLPLQALLAWKAEEVPKSRSFALLRSFALQLAHDPAAAAALSSVGWPASWHLSGGPDIFVEYCRRTEELLSGASELPAFGAGRAVTPSRIVAAPVPPMAE